MRREVRQIRRRAGDQKATVRSSARKAANVTCARSKHDMCRKRGKKTTVPVVQRDWGDVPLVSLRKEIE
eukprot:12933607-Prorocentrum_lima.AAC.1